MNFEFFKIWSFKFHFIRYFKSSPVEYIGQIGFDSNQIGLHIKRKVTRDKQEVVQIAITTSIPYNPLDITLLRAYRKSVKKKKKKIFTVESRFVEKWSKYLVYILVTWLTIYARLHTKNINYASTTHQVFRIDVAEVGPPRVKCHEASSQWRHE